MTRPRQQAYRSSEMSELARQLMYAPADKRADVVRHAEELHDDLDRQKNYPIDYVIYRLTERRVPTRDSVMLVGEALGPDLRLLIDALSRSIAMPPNPTDPGETTNELAQRLGVSTKTVGRWRDAGLRWRWGVREEGGKPTVLITRAALRAFQDEKPGRVESAAAFSQMDEVEKHRLTARARRLADATDARPQTILEHLARRSGRSVEGLRQMIASHDQRHPDAAVFGDRAGPLTDKQKRVIGRAYTMGVTVSAMCRRYRKTRSTIYRAIHEARGRQAAQMPIHVVGSPTFDREDADEVLMRPIDRSGKPRRLGEQALAVLPDALHEAYDRPIDSDKVTRTLIVRYNFLKHRARQAQQQLASPPVRAADLDRFTDLLKRAGAERGQALAGTLPIVLSVVLRQWSGSGHDSSAELLSLLDLGSVVLIEELERFDVALSHTFESVLTNRLLRTLASPDETMVLLTAGDVLDRLVGAGLAFTDESD